MIAVHGKDTKPGLTLAALWHRRGLLFGLTAGALLLAGLLLATIPPLYTGEALVALTVRNENDQLVDRQSGGPAPPTPGQVQTEMEVLRSRELAGQVVDQLELLKDPEFNSAIRPVSALARRLSGLWAAAGRRLPDWARLPSRPAVEGERRAATVDRVMKGLKVSADADSFAIHIAFSAHDAEKSARIANAFADIYVLGQLKKKFDDIERATAWVSKQIVSLQQQVDVAAHDVADYREHHHLTALAADPGLMSSQQIVSLTTELGQAQQATADAEIKLRDGEAWLRHPVDLPPVDLVAQSPFIQALRSQEATVLARLAEMQAHYRDNHPAVVELRDELARLRGDIAGEVGKVVQNLSSQVVQARSREKVLRQRMAEITADTNRQSLPLAEMAQRQRDVDVKTAMLQSFMARYNEIANRMEVEKPDARVVSRATPPTGPSHPKPLLFLGIALAGASGLGVSLVALMERWRPGYATTQQVRQELGLPTLGVVPELRRLPARATASDYMIDKPTSVYAEAIKAAQLAILGLGPETAAKRIMVASSLPGEGKTSFAISLARSLAGSGYRSLLMDCDFRRPSVERHFTADSATRRGGPGLVDLLRQSAPLDDVIRFDERTGLYFTPAGSACDDPQKLLDSSLSHTMMTALMNRFDVVVVDTPPTMVASDSAVLVRSTDLVLYVVAWDKTPRGAVQAGIEYLQSHGATIAGVVLSKVDMSRSGRYGDYVDYAFRHSEYYTK